MFDSTIYKKISEYLLDLVKVNGAVPGYKLPSERLLAEKFNASRIPVRAAYAKLVERGYVERVHGKGCFIKKTVEIHSLKSAAPEKGLKNICFITPSIKSVLMQRIISGIESFCEQHSIEFSIKISDQSAVKEKRLIQSVQSSGLKGIILFPIDNEYFNNELLKLSLGKFPITVIDRYLRTLNLSCVMVDNYNAMVEAVRFLYRKKFENIVYITPPSTLATAIEERINGFNHGLFKYYGVAKANNMLKIKPDDAAAQNAALIDYLKKFPETEVVIATGAQAASVISAAAELNIPIPKKMKLMIISCELSDIEMRIFRPYTIEIDGHEIGFEAAAALYNQIYGDLRVIIKRLPTKIIDCSAF